MGVWNMWNRSYATMASIDTGVQYTYSTATIRQARASAGNQNSYTIGLVEDAVDAYYLTRVDTPATSTSFCIVGIGLDSTTVISGQRGFSQTVANVVAIQTPALRQQFYPTLGFHTAAALEQATAVCAYDGDSTAQFTTSLFN